MGFKYVKVKFWFCDPEKAHPCQEPRHLTYFASKFVGASWLYVISWTQKNSRINNLVRDFAHAQKQNPLSDLDQILQSGRYPRRNRLCKFRWRSVKGFRDKICPSPLTFIVAVTTLSHYRASVWLCDYYYYYYYYYKHPVDNVKHKITKTAV